jgi:hypothetical protein
MDAHKVDQHEAETDGKAGKLASALLCISGAKYYEHEDEGEHSLNDEACQLAACTCAAVGSCEGAAKLGGSDAGDGIEYGSGDDGTDYLEYDVAYGILSTDTLGEKATDSDGGVNVASAYATDGVSHGYYSKAKSHCSAHNGCGVNAAV